MQLSLPADGSIIAKSKSETVSFGNTVQINDYIVPGQGEYDVAGIQCEVHNLNAGLVYFVRFEDLQLTYLSQIDAGVSKLDDASNCNILAVEVRSDDSPENLRAIIKSLEPSYVVLRGAGATTEFRTLLNLPVQEITLLKVNRASLPLEGTSVLYS